MPIMRALWLHDPTDPVGAARGDQYLWGADILVAPVVEKGATVRKLYLPRGQWVDFWTEAALLVVLQAANHVTFARITER